MSVAKTFDVPELPIEVAAFTRRKRREDEQQLLAVAGEHLSSSLDFEETLLRFGEIVLHAFADFVVLDAVEEEEGALCRARVLACDPMQEEARLRLQEVAADDAALRFGTPSPSSSRALVRRDVHSSDQLVEGVSAAQLCALREAGALHAVDVALVGRDGLFATALLVSCDPQRRYGERDRWLIEELARRATTALENARLYQAAQDATRARDEVMGIVAHDLRNPLTSILLSGRALLMKRAGNELDEGDRAAVRFMLLAAERMKRLVDDLVDFRRHDAGSLVIDAVKQPAAAVAAEAVYALEPLVRLASLTFVARVQPDLPHISADRERVIQVLSNLVGNAIKFTPAGGVVTLEVRREGDVVLFGVRDTGRGIPEADRPRVFHRFYQTCSDDRRRGAGLGLAISRTLVESHGGRIWVDSEVGAGSTFWFSLPSAC